MVNIILYVLERIPYKSKFGLSLSELLKIWHYHRISKKRCFCGGHISVDSLIPEGWEVRCDDCFQLFDED